MFFLWLFCLSLFAYRSLLVALCLSPFARRSLLIAPCLSLLAYRSLHAALFLPGVLSLGFPPLCLSFFCLFLLFLLSLCFSLFAYRSLPLSPWLSLCLPRVWLFAFPLFASLFFFFLLFPSFASLSMLLSLCSSPFACHSSSFAPWLSRSACGASTAREWSWTVLATSPPPQTASNGLQVRPTFSENTIPHTRQITIYV